MTRFRRTLFSRWLTMPALLLVAGCSAGESSTMDSEYAEVLATVTIPAEHRDGEAFFNANCATCHGQLALGTDRGPALVHIIYEPSHHADLAFVMAVERGVRAHHWRFGDMPPIPSVNREQTGAIVGYIRFLQRQVGIH